MNIDNTQREVVLKIQNSTLETLSLLHNIWSPCFDVNTIEAYTGQLYDHVSELFNDIIEDAQSTKVNLSNKVEDLLKEISNVCAMLSENLEEESHLDVPLDNAVNILEKKLQGYKEELESRENEVNLLLKNENLLCEELGIPVKSLNCTPLPSAGELIIFRRYLENLKDESDSRNSKMEMLRTEIIGLFDELGISPSLDFERRLIKGKHIKCSDSNIERVSSMCNTLKEQLRNAKITTLELREKLSHLWERLEESPLRRSEFYTLYPGHTVKTIQALRSEIGSCEEKKRLNIKIFIEKMRKELLQLWDKCMLSYEERSSFVHYNSDCYTEDLLTLHEMQVEKYEHFYKSNEQIFNLLNKRSELWDTLVELEQRANAPNRYNNRGGQLLQEEKERKRIATHLPKLEAELKLMVQRYYEDTNVVFTVNGEPVEDMIERVWEQHKQDKKCQLSTRKQAKETNTQISTPASCRSKLMSNTKSCTNILIATPIKRKRSPQCSSVQKNIKLQLTTKDMNSPLGSVPSSSGKIKPIKKAVAVHAPIFKRRSGRRLSNNKKSLIKNKLKNSYSEFVEHISTRSSIVPREIPRIRLQTPSKSERTLITPARIVKPSTAGRTPRVLSSTNIKSGLSYTRSDTVLSPGTNKSQRKLTTKNLPIII